MAIVGRVLYWITSARLIVAVWLPALAVTVTLLAPVGVPGVLEPPEHAVRTVASGSRRISINRPAIRFLLPISPASTKILRQRIRHHIGRGLRLRLHSC